MFGIVDNCSFCIDFVFFFERKKKNSGKGVFSLSKENDSYCNTDRDFYCIINICQGPQTAMAARTHTPTTYRNPPHRQCMYKNRRLNTLESRYM